MQTEATGSNSAIADGSSTLIPFGYSDLVDRHFQTHVMAGFPLPPPLGDGMISFRGGEEWKDGSFFESTKTGVDYTFHGLPFDESSRWGFNRGGFEHNSIMSIASSHPRVVQGVSELSSSSYTMHTRRVGSDNTSCSSNSLSMNLEPAVNLLSGSRFFQAMQEILAEFACYAMESFDHRPSSTNGCSDGPEPDHRLVLHATGKEKEAESKRKHLLSLLQVVDDQYNQCLDEIHTIVSAFHVVTELDPNLHSRFALPAISLMYRNLRERISSHILSMGARHSEGDARQGSSFETSFIQKQWALQQLKKSDHQLWRPQRGLPERSVSVLRAWMFQNFLHPYPKDAEKHLLAMKSGLTRSQVSNWFINARVRLWKPMIEEMYAEMNRSKARREEEEEGNGHGSHWNHLSRRFTVE